MNESPKLADEIQKMQVEELLPVEKKLIAWSLIIGIAFLGVLVWLSRTFFPGG